MRIFFLKKQLKPEHSVDKITSQILATLSKPPITQIKSSINLKLLSMELLKRKGKQKFFKQKTKLKISSDFS